MINHKSQFVNALFGGLFAVVVCYVLAVLPTYAAPVIRSGDTVDVAVDQVVEGDLYAAAETATISGPVNGDVLLLGKSITVNSSIAADFMVAANTIQLHGPIGDDVRVLAGEITIADEVAGDVVVVGGSVTVLSTARIKGDLIFLAKSVSVQGPVEGTVYGYAETVRIDTTIGKDVSVTATEGLTLTDGTEVLGNITYTGNKDIERAPGTVVIGEIQSNPLAANGSGYEGILISLGMLLFGALSVFLLMKPTLQTLVEKTEVNFGTQGLIGLAVLLGAPVIAGLLMFSIIGALIGILLLLLFLILLLATWIIAGPVLGMVIWRQLKLGKSLSISGVIVGVILFESLIFIPYIGPIAALAVFAIVLGGLSRHAYSLLIAR